MNAYELVWLTYCLTNSQKYDLGNAFDDISNMIIKIQILPTIVQFEHIWV